MRTRTFHITVRSTLAAFLLMGGLQGVLLGAGEPLGAWAIRMINWFIAKIKPDSFQLNGAAISWTYVWAEVAIGLILLILAVSIGAGVKPSRKKSVS